jgi:hypothetical protein
MPSPSWHRITAPGLPELPAFAHAAVAGDDIYVAPARIAETARFEKTASRAVATVRRSDEFCDRKPS